MIKFNIEPTKFKEVLIITPKTFEDNRGYFCETYNIESLRKLNFVENMFQDNESYSKKNVIRGMHFQWDQPLGKLVRVAKGSVMDVVVDIRKNSPTYGQHLRLELTDKNHKQLWVPPGFAHGFLSLEEGTYVMYKYSNAYNQKGESGIDPFDETLNIDWGIPREEIVLSSKDSKAQSFIEYDQEPKFIFT